MMKIVMGFSRCRCDDNDSNSTIVNEDFDCDGILTDDDCDDTKDNPYLAIDGDCDGILTEDDCNDNNPISTTVDNDEDCDGVLPSMIV